MRIGALTFFMEGHLITLTVHIIVIVKKKIKRPTPEAKRFRLGPGARSIVMTSDQSNPIK